MNIDKLDLLLGEINYKNSKTSKTDKKKQRQINNNDDDGDENVSTQNNTNRETENNDDDMSIDDSNDNATTKKTPRETSKTKKDNANIEEADKTKKSENAEENDHAKYVSHIIGKSSVNIPKSSILHIMHNIPAPKNSHINISNYEKSETKKEKKTTISPSAISLLREIVSRTTSQLLEKSTQSRDIRSRETLVHQDLTLAIYDLFDETTTDYFLNCIASRLKEKYAHEKIDDAKNQKSKDSDTDSNSDETDEDTSSEEDTENNNNDDDDDESNRQEEPINNQNIETAV